MIWSNIYRVIGGPYHGTDIESDGDREIRLVAPSYDGKLTHRIHSYRLRDSSKGDQVYVYAGVHGSN